MASWEGRAVLPVRDGRCALGLLVSLQEGADFNFLEA